MHLSEFAAAKDQPELALTGFVHAFAGRAVWTAIGNCDGRVGTECCLRFAEAIVRAEATTRCATSRFVLHVVPEVGHSLSDNWRRRGGEYLLATAGREE